MAITITESGMEFGPFENETCFYIEKSRIYSELHYSFRISEFLVFQKEHNRLLIVEAKSSSPNPGSSIERFEQFIDEISEKLNHAWNLTLSMLLRRHESFYDELPVAFKELDFASLNVVLLLVIKGHNSKWLPPLQEALQKSLKNFSRIWKTRVFVINDKLAKSYGLIVPTKSACVSSIESGNSE